MTEHVGEPEVEARPAAEFVARVKVEPPGPELARKNILFGLALFGLFVLLFGGTVLVALIYLAVAD
jgi:hypothetical protein